MAKKCKVRSSLCMYFILIAHCATALSIEDYYSYDVASSSGRQKSDNSLHLNPILNSVNDEDHRVYRRDVANNKTDAKSQNSTVVKSADESRTDHGGPTSPDSNNNSTLSNQKNDTTIKPMRTTKATTQPPTTLPKIVQKNLGENGAGQRKYVFNSTTAKPITTTGDEDDLPILDDEDVGVFNQTLSKYNITESRNDTHIYYNSSLINDPEVGQTYWVNLTNNKDTKINDLLSKSHRRAATIKLSFDFPFYGHLIKNVTIATGGFLYTGDYVHSWLAATQYIAPLMANFDTSLLEDSLIRYADNGTSFTVEWKKVVLQDNPHEGQFTFQTTLYQNGDIVFVYKNVPVFIKEIVDDHHPVKVGLSDAYIIDRAIFFVRRKTIYEYHRVNFQKEMITNWTVIYLKALSTCLENKDCVTCLTNKQAPFNCQWCPSANRCSTGLDRHRQDWLMKGCDRKRVDQVDMCSHVSGDDVFDKSNTTYAHDETEFNHQMLDFSRSTRTNLSNASAFGANQPVRMGVSGIVAILFLIAMVAGLGVWVLYAYRNPHTTSGQILIRYRPSQWRWRRGEARYTAATIHM